MMIGPRFMMIGPRFMMVGPRFMMIGPRFMMIGPRFMMIGPRFMMIGPRFMMIGPRFMMIGPRFMMIGPHSPYDFEDIVRTRGRPVRLPGRRDTWREPSAPDTTVAVIQKPQETIMKTNNTTLKSRNTSVMAGIDKHITTSIIINGTLFTQADLKAIFQSQIVAITTNRAQHNSLADSVVNAGAIGVKVNSPRISLAIRKMPQVERP